MTRAQRLELLKQIEKDIYVCSLESTFLDDAKSCAIHSAIEELEQEPILDKIRTEIEAEKLEDSPNFCVKAHNNAVDRVLGIIDKYKAETEER